MCHVLICCDECNDGVTFLVDGKWNANHDFRDIDQARDVSTWTPGVYVVKIVNNQQVYSKKVIRINPSSKLSGAGLFWSDTPKSIYFQITLFLNAKYSTN